MALDLRISCQGEPFQNSSGPENLKLKLTQGPAIQEGEKISRFPNTKLSLFQNSNNSCARQELQKICESFHLWLQPEKHSKDEIISLLVLEQFMINRHFSDRSMLKEKWESSGRNLETFMEDLSDDCMKPPGLVQVHMQGQEALFSENMPLREVIIHFKKQLSVETLTEANMGTPYWTAQEISQTGQGDEDKENCGNISLKTTEVNDSITSQGNQTPSLFIIQGENCPGPDEEGGVSLENPLSSRRATLGTFRSQEGSLERPSYQDLMEMRPAFLSRSNQVTTMLSTHQSNVGNPTDRGHQERCHGAQKSYQCEKCPKVFRYFSRLKVHQRRHNNERTFFCAVCDKGFFQASDLHTHQNIHAGQKPFRCSLCARSFSHRTNLQAHERIHTGEKPYVCSQCKRRYRQSSTYHRHLRMHQRTALGCVSSTPEASLM